MSVETIGRTEYVGYYTINGSLINGKDYWTSEGRMLFWFDDMDEWMFNGGEGILYSTQRSEARNMPIDLDVWNYLPEQDWEGDSILVDPLHVECVVQIFRSTINLIF